MADSYDCPACGAEVSIEVEHWTELIGWRGPCPACGAQLEMENDNDADDNFSFWLREDEEIKRDVLTLEEAENT